MEKGILGPHEGKELELMLRGEKQVALFNQELGIPDAFLPYLELGMLHSKTVQRHVNDVCLTDFNKVVISLAVLLNLIFLTGLKVFSSVLLSIFKVL